MDDKFLKKKLKKHIPEFLRELSEEYPFYVAGGAITSIVTNQDINDLDVYIKSDCDIMAFVNEVLRQSTILAVTKKSMVVSHSGKTINVIFLDTYRTAEDIFKSFDFTCVMGAYDVYNDTFIFHDDFLLHNAQKILRFNKETAFPIMSALRVHKYQKKGFKISKNEYLRILLTCCTLSISTYEDLGEQIGGMYGLDVDKIFDTSEEFVLSNVIDKILEIDVDYDSYDDRQNDNVLRERIYEAVYRLLAKRGYKFTRIPIKTFNEEGIDKEIDFLGVNGRLYVMPEYLKDMELETQTSDIIVYASLNENDGNFKLASTGHSVNNIGDIIEFTPSNSWSKGFEVKTFDHIDFSTHSYVGVFKVRANYVEKIGNSNVGYGRLMFLKMELVDILNKKVIKDTYDNKIMGIFD